MNENPDIQSFIKHAREIGISEQALVGMLTVRGWPEKEVYEALAIHYEQQVGTSIPARKGSGTAAKDAFFYLLIFSTLATWTIALGALAFTLIDRWLADSLFSTPYNQGYDVYSAAASMASILVAFPVYLLVTKMVTREERQHPEKLMSPVRKWLTYMALVIAACIFIGDLIAALTYFLRGEITSRFLAKAFVVLAISGGIFFYYYGGVRRSEHSEGQGKGAAWMAALSSILVVILLGLGFATIGAPSTQRMLRADQKRVQDLYTLSDKVRNFWSSQHKLPEHLDVLADVPLADPITRVASEYHPRSESGYELCATFAASRERDDPTSRAKVWTHPAGRHCFSIDAQQMLDNPYIYSPY